MEEIIIGGKKRYKPSDMTNNQLVVTLMLFCTKREELEYIDLLKNELMNRLESLP